MGGLKYHKLRVLEVVDETADARSVSFEVPVALRETFRHKPGQHLQLHVPCGPRALPRCYSLTCVEGEPLRVTVKRVADGRASNWICSSLKAGDALEVAAPAGVFTPKSLDGEFLMFAAGSGITPVFCILRAVLAKGSGRMKLVYANRDEKSVIFRDELARLSREYPDRLEVVHWLDSVQGLPSGAQIAALAHGSEQSECFVCGPSVFMDATAAALRGLGVPNARLHIERFVSLPEDADDAPAVTVDTSAPRTTITVELDGATHEVSGTSGELLIESLENAGLSPPFSCRAGACAACMCHLEEGDVELVHNHVLSEQEMNEGWILACQAVPTSPKVRVKYPS